MNIFNVNNFNPSSQVSKFIFKISLFATLFVLLNVIVIYFADGFSDPYYLRFTSPKQKSLILGSSRSAQCLQPEIINNQLKLDGDDKIFNFSFTNSTSPYGEIYLNAVKKKLDTNTTGGIFILTVDPWSVSSISKDPENNKEFRENKNVLATTNIFDGKPNFDYLKNSFHKGYLGLFFNPARLTRVTYLHKDGWLEISVEKDSLEFDKKSKAGVKTYYKNLKTFNLSKFRLAYLEKTIVFLKEYGDVYLVRLPIYKKFQELEQEFLPEFDSLMMDLSSRNKTDYINFFNHKNNYLFLDGHHIWKESGAEVSLLLAKEIISDKK
jgi:hypothetical protein